jgi:hypothetical protein
LRLEPYLKLEPNDATARDICLKLHGNRAHALGGLQKHAESATEWARVLELSPKPIPDEYRIRLALELVPSGELARALEQAERVKSTSGMPADDRYNLACLYALCAGSVVKDGNISTPDRSRLVDSHTTNALAWLKSAHDAGVFDKPGMRDYAKKDPDLAILADRPEFKQIVEPPPTNR